MITRRAALAAGGAAALAGLTGLTGPAGPARGASAATPAVPTTPAELLAWVRAHPRRASLVVLDARGRPLVAQRPRRPMPLASTRKILVLAAAAEQVAAGRWDLDDEVAQGELDRWYLPGTDGGAHPAALEAYGTDWSLRTALDAMIVFSDNAAADVVLDRVGGPAAVDRLSRRLGLRDQDPIWSLRGEYLAWADEPRAWLAASPRRRQQIAGRLAAASQGPVTPGLPSVAAQRCLPLASVRGSMLDFARLQRLGRRRAAAGDPAAGLAVDVLSWPRADPDTAAAFPVFATKGGAFAGVVTEATAIQAAGRRPIYVAQAYRLLPAGVEQRLRTDFLQQQLYVALAQGTVRPGHES